MPILGSEGRIPVNQKPMLYLLQTTVDIVTCRIFDVTGVSDSTQKRDILRIVAIVTISSLLSAVVVLVVTEQAVSKQRDDILAQKSVAASALAARFQLRISDMTAALQLAARSAEFSTVNDADSVSEQHRGLPGGYEDAKRKFARDILLEYESFETFAFVLPSGDIYFVEPYDRQLSLPRLNYSDRDWYRVTIETGQAFASDTIISTATNHRVIPIGVPVYSNDSLIGLIVGAMDLEILENQLRAELNLMENNRAVYVDDKGNVIEDVSSTTTDTFASIVSMAHLQSVKDVIGGKTGHIIEMVGETEMLTVYKPTSINGRSWGVLIMQPLSDAFSSSDYLRNQAYILLAVLIAVTAASGYLLISFRIHSSLARELANANSELTRKEKMKDEFLKLASHELRTPIQPILGYSSLGVRGLVSDDLAWRVVHKEAQRLMRLANNIVDITMLQSGAMKYDMVSTRAIDPLQSSIDEIRPVAQDKNLRVEVFIEERCQEIYVTADSARLKRVFDEILENAVKFTSSGVISIGCKAVEESHELVIGFRDTGSQIDPAILPRIFDIFSSKSSIDPTTQGAGLGLFICQSIVKAHGGRITVHNITDGIGVIFEVRLPLIIANKAATAA